MSGLAAFYWILAVVIWLLIAFWPARVAARKGHSFLGFFLLSLLFFPLSLLLAYLVHDRTHDDMTAHPVANP